LIPWSARRSERLFDEVGQLHLAGKAIAKRPGGFEWSTHYGRQVPGFAQQHVHLVDKLSQNMVNFTISTWFYSLIVQA
jgi:hypothetical protein